ncbi:acetate/propionate family kinase [Undibacterium sp. Rencai35W]|uniref:acetate/propionate family kinase n=1 Tax=Undibacterium sp. Rencai35W TaxID=3413046 RepID=UPI003BF2C6E0
MSDAIKLILSVNSGSSSIKFALYPCEQGTVEAAILTGLVEGLEPQGIVKVTIRRSGESPISTRIDIPEGEDRFARALTELHQLLQHYAGDVSILAVAHRIVHGGDRYSRSIRLGDEDIHYLHGLDCLAPLHQPHNLDGVIAFQNAYPGVPQIACFDTGFHADLPEVERTLALPKRIRELGVRRYGFHGLSYRYVAGRLHECSLRSRQRVVMAHLGNGASLCAMYDGQSRATTMGFSALDGLMMGTRCGALDAGVILYLLQQGWTATQLESSLYKESGLLGVSGISADMRRLRACEDLQAKAAIDLFTHRIVREIGAMTACVGGIDLLVFTGGIGEHDAVLRQQVCEQLSYLNLHIDNAKNVAAQGDAIAAVHTASSPVEIWVVPTDEGRIAAMDAAKILQG